MSEQALPTYRIDCECGRVIADRIVGDETFDATTTQVLRAASDHAGGIPAGHLVTMTLIEEVSGAGTDSNRDSRRSLLPTSALRHDNPSHR